MLDPNPDMRDGMAGMFQYVFRDLANDLASGRITGGDWQVSMRDELRSLHALELIAAAGGSRSDVSPDDWLRLGNVLKQQYGYLEDFAREIVDGNLSAAQIGARAELYAGSGKQSYWSQVTSETDLPAQPGDGSTACKGHCGCSWVHNADGSWSWVRGKTDSCDDCIWREGNWNPYEAAA